MTTSIGRPVPQDTRSLRILLGLTGSAGLMSMSKYLEHFRAELHPEIRILMTPMAEQIVPKQTWLALGPGGVFTDADWVSAEHVATSRRLVAAVHNEYLALIDTHADSP
jgi:3-polyprenyl-4-hydroxybenzoate decarboxylase